MLRPNESEVINLTQFFQAKLEMKPRFIDDFSRQTATLTGITHHIAPDLESQQRTLKARQEEKSELDAKFTEIIEMIRQTRKSIEDSLQKQEQSEPEAETKSMGK
jgi:hypothetical protein